MRWIIQFEPVICALQHSFQNFTKKVMQSENSKLLEEAFKLVTYILSICPFYASIRFLNLLKYAPAD